MFIDSFSQLIPGMLIKNLLSHEPVRINKIQNLGSKVSIAYTGLNSNHNNTRIISHDEIPLLEILGQEGSFNFKGDPVRFLLCAEAERIKSAYQFDPLFAVNCSVVDPLPHQIEAIYKFLLPLPKIRFLLADDTGAGKTIMAGLLVKELIMRGLADRIMIITPGGLTKQWQEDEMETKFNLPFTLVNRARLSSDPLVFQNEKRIVTSIDFICREDVLKSVEGSHWDLVIFDEAHKLSAYDYGDKTHFSNRYKAAQCLSLRTEHLLLLTATPHRGRTDTFKRLMQLLDEDIFATDEITASRVQEYEKDGVNKFFIRRLKEDMCDWNGEPLYKKRSTKTVSYTLTPEEKYLYDEVTRYLSKKKEEAEETNNVHVSLALTVMQRRLVSSIYALKNTMQKRHVALQSLIEEVRKNPSIWNQRHKLEGYDLDTIDDYDELDDDERDGLESILSDPRKFKLFTTATSIRQIEEEARQVGELYQLAESLYLKNQEEQKYVELKKLLVSENVINGEKLVIFTEHKDTLIYLKDRLENSGYKVVVIHGGKSVDERREAQWEFSRKETQILIATDAAGEGINLQFCRLLINWDIPWNPNRLEQRMGRIHRYGQKNDVVVCNLVAGNTREGSVLERLLSKIEIIRQGIGDDRVYDVIQDVLEGVSLEDVISSVFKGEHTSFDDLIDQDEQSLQTKFSEKINDQKKRLSHTSVNYEYARDLKERSDEKRLQPIYIEHFFKAAFDYYGGTYETHGDVFKITHLPDICKTYLRNEYNISAGLNDIYFTFDKNVFLEFKNTDDRGAVHYINPGNPLFDALVNIVRTQCNPDLLQGAVLISPDDKNPYTAYFVKTQMVDSRPSRQGDTIIDEQLALVYKEDGANYIATSPAKLLDLYSPNEFAKIVDTPPAESFDDVIAWSFAFISEPQSERVSRNVRKDVEMRREYLKDAFNRVTLDLQAEIGNLQVKALNGDARLNEKIKNKQNKVGELKIKREERLTMLDQMLMVHQKEPVIMGCARVIPLSQVEYKTHFGMSRDDEVEKIAMQCAIDYEISQGRTPCDVSAENEGYDIRSVDSDTFKRYIEVKGRSGIDGVMLSENEKNRLSQLGNSAWLYIVVHCKSSPQLYRIQNPGKTLSFETKSKGIQYYLPLKEWQKNADLS